MTMKLDLEPDTEAGLLAQAQASGLSLEAYVQQLLREKSLVAGLTRSERPSQAGVLPRKRLAEVFEPLRGLDLDFRRNESVGRSVDL